MAELKENEFNEPLCRRRQGDEEGRVSGEHFVTETNIESDIPAFFPEEYVPSSPERMSLYRELDGLSTPKQLEDYKKRLVDRFGQYHPSGKLFSPSCPSSGRAQRLGIEKVVLKMGTHDSLLRP